jgi:hypothetical protein
MRVGFLVEHVVGYGAPKTEKGRMNGETPILGPVLFESKSE